MKLRLLLAAGASLLALAVIGAGCGGDGEALTLEEYFQRLEAIDADVDQRFEELFAQFPEDEEAFTNEENLPLLKDVLPQFPVILKEAIDEAAALEPPGEAKDAHDAFVAAGRDLLPAFEVAVDGIEAADSVSEVEQILDEEELAITASEDAFDAACLALVAVGTANGITVDIDCEE